MIPTARYLTGPPCLATVGENAIALMCQGGRYPEEGEGWGRECGMEDQEVRAAVRM